MRLPIYQIDAFARAPFTGNPAAVVPLEEWLPDQTLQAIAAENNLAETAFFVPLQGDDEADFHLRWLTSATAVALCGHATLATGHVLRAHRGVTSDRIAFRCRSGVVAVEVEGDRLTLDFPSLLPRQRDRIPALYDALGKAPGALLETAEVGGMEGYLLAIYNTRADVESLAPDFRAMIEHDCGMVTVTAPADEGDDCDFVSRFFAPGHGIDEDHATGSIHAMLTPFWTHRLGKQTLFARQLSPRGAEMWCSLDGARARIGGRCFTYMQGEIEIAGDEATERQSDEG